MDVVFAKDKNGNNPVKDKAKQVISKIKSWKVPSSLYYFLILVGIGIGFYFLMLVENHFTLAYGGDYSGQYIPMAYHVWDYYHDWIKTGHFTLFDQTIYLGSNAICSNAYYGLFSPFNIIIVIFPRAIVPQTMAFCSIIKLACAGLFFSIYMERTFKVKVAVARLCGIAYAFAGWGAFYLWYNNYQDILVFFPIILLGIEKVLKEKKPWLLCVGVFLITICNYVLMVPYIICAFIYAMFRFFQKVHTRSFVENLKLLGLGVIGFAGGLMMSMFVFGPAIMATLASPKLDSYSYFGVLKGYLAEKDYSNFFKLLFSWKAAPDQHGYIIPSRVLYPILEFFVPATTCRSLPTIQMYEFDFDDMAVSLWCYVPFIMFLVPALIQSGKEKRWSHFIAFIFFVVALFTPVMYFLTMAMSNGYARWTLFVASSLIAYVGVYIDKIPNVSRWHMHVGVAFAIIGVVAAWIITEKLVTTELPSNVVKHYYFRYRFIEYFGNDNKEFNFTTVAFIIELVYVVGVYLTLLFTYYKKVFHIVMTLFISAEAVLMGNFVTWGHGFDTNYNNGYALNYRFKGILNQIQSKDKTFYRIYSSLNDDYSINNNMMNKYSSADFFHSLYNFEVDDFTLETGMRDRSTAVAGRYRGKYQDVDNLLGIKYYFISKAKSKYTQIEKYFPNSYMANVPFDFERSAEYGVDSKDFIVYKNNQLNDFGYTYDSLYSGLLRKKSYVVEGQPFYESDAIRNAIAMSTSAQISAEDGQEIAALYGDISVSDEKVDTNSLKQLSYTTYKTTYYDLESIFGQNIDYGEGIGYKKIWAAYDYPFGEIVKVPDRFTPTSYYTREKTNSAGQQISKATDYFAFYESKTEGEPIFPEGTALYIFAPFSGSQKYSFHFIDKDNNIFMFDSHDDDTTDNICQMRGFYLKKDVYKIAVCGKYSNSHFSSRDGEDAPIFTFFSESKDDYVARRQKLNANKFENVKYSSDKFSFTTNYDKNLLVVSRVSFDKGWKVTAKVDGKAQTLKTYKANGGFLSFVAPKGNVSYTMTYETPYLGISYLVTALATTSFFVSLVGYHIYQDKKRQHYLDKLFRENY